MNDGFVKKSEDEKYLLIDGCILINAYIPEYSETKCDNCKAPAIYHDKFDAYLCVYCNVWLEKKCGDPNCEYCPTRPESPLPDEAKRRRIRNEGKKVVYP